MDFKARLEGIAVGVRAGVYSINDARLKENLPPVEYGDEIRVQQQDVPLSAWHEQATAPIAPPAPAPEAPPAAPPAAGEETSEASLAAFRRAFEEASNAA